MQDLEDLLVAAEDHGIKNMILALEGVPEDRMPPSRPSQLVLDNRDCRFVPHVSVLTLGSTIVATNSDSVLHTEHYYGALSANVALPFKDATGTTTAASPGMIIVKCDVHSWMQAFIRIDAHPFHAVTDVKGYFRIADVPPGTYRLEIWHEKLGQQEKTIRIEAAETQTIQVEYRTRQAVIIVRGPGGMPMRRKTIHSLAIASLLAGACSPPPTEQATEEARQQATQAATQEATPRRQPGAEITLYAPEQHDLYDGHFVLSAGRVFRVGELDDPPGWDHIDNDASNVHATEGTVDIDVDEVSNTGSFVVRLQLPEGELVVELDRFHEFNPCQAGGVAAYIYEHGDSGCGDANWPKTFIYIAGWGYGHATLNGERIYEDYEMHFMVTQGMRDRNTLEVNYPLLNKRTSAGAVDPAAQQLDFYIRSPETDARNNPTREVFAHFFAMEVTWK